MASSETFCWKSGRTSTDYARLAILTDAETAMRLLPAWFEDYNTIHPHFGLRMLSPREYLSRTA